MKCRYNPKEPAENAYKIRFRSFTRQCLSGAIVETLYLDFGFGMVSRIPRFMNRLHEVVKDLDDRYGIDSNAACREMCGKLTDMGLAWKYRDYTALRGYSYAVHDSMAAAAVYVLVEDFGFAKTFRGDSRTWKFLCRLNEHIRYENHINDGIYSNRDPRVIHFNEMLKGHLESYGIPTDYILKEIYRW